MTDQGFIDKYGFSPEFFKELKAIMRLCGGRIMGIYEKKTSMRWLPTPVCSTWKPSALLQSRVRAKAESRQNGVQEGLCISNNDSTKKGKKKKGLSELQQDVFIGW